MPQIEIKRHGYRYFFAITNGCTVVGVPAFPQIYVANNAFPYVFYGLNKRREGTALVAHLDQLTILMHSLYQQFPFIGIVRTGLFYIHMFAMRYAKNSSRRMPMVGSGNDQPVKVLLLHQLPDVFYDSGFPAGLGKRL